jgi:hypothetical protein
MCDWDLDGRDAEAETDSGTVVAVFEGGVACGRAAREPRGPAGPRAGVDAPGDWATRVVAGEEPLPLLSEGGMVERTLQLLGWRRGEASIGV